MRTDFTKVIDFMTDTGDGGTTPSDPTTAHIEEIEQRLTEKLDTIVNNALDNASKRYSQLYHNNITGDTDTATDDTDTATDTDTDTANNETITENE